VSALAESLTYVIQLASLLQYPAPGRHLQPYPGKEADQDAILPAELVGM
jgi:hypothetical protein